MILLFLSAITESTESLESMCIRRSSTEANFVSAQVDLKSTAPESATQCTMDVFQV